MRIALWNQSLWKTDKSFPSWLSLIVGFQSLLPFKYIFIHRGSDQDSGRRALSLWRSIAKYGNIVDITHDWQRWSRRVRLWSLTRYCLRSPRKELENPSTVLGLVMAPAKLRKIVGMKRSAHERHSSASTLTGKNSHIFAAMYKIIQSPSKAPSQPPASLRYHMRRSCIHVNVEVHVWCLWLTIKNWSW